MSEPPRRVAILRAVVAWSLGWAIAAALYLLLIDTTSLPELLVGVGAAALAATGFELAREQRIAGETIRTRWLLRLHRPLIKVFSDITVVSRMAMRQLFARATVRGQFRAVRFHRGDQERLETGRRSLAEMMGSFAPNTIIVGVDGDRELMLAHQLRRSGGPEAIDLMELR